MEEEVKEFLEYMIKEGKRDNDPISPVCLWAIKEPLTKSLCYDFRRIRRRVLCLAWKFLEEERIPFAEAIRRAWKKTKEDCAKISAII